MNQNNIFGLPEFSDEEISRNAKDQLESAQNAQAQATHKRYVAMLAFCVNPEGGVDIQCKWADDSDEIAKYYAGLINGLSTKSMIGHVFTALEAFVKRKSVSPQFLKKIKEFVEEYESLGSMPSIRPLMALRNIHYNPEQDVEEE